MPLGPDRCNDLFIILMEAVHINPSCTQARSNLVLPTSMSSSRRNSYVLNVYKKPIPEEKYIFQIILNF
jgi:hypothetical protein